MAKERGSGSFGWFIIGVLVGAALMVLGYLYMTRDKAGPAREGEIVAPGEAPPVAASPVAPAVPTRPVVALPKEPPKPLPPPVRTEPDPQLDEDAAAAGMTGPVNPPADQPTN